MKDIRTRLRQLTLNDIDDRYASWYDNEDGHLNYYTTSGRSFSKEWLIDELENSKNNFKHFYAVLDAGKDIVIGNVRIGPIHEKHKTSDLVAFIGDRDYLGKRLSPVIIKQANQIAFDRYDIRKLAGGMIESHIGSIKAYVRAGWIIEGILKQHHIINGQPQDFIQVACFNPKYFSKKFLAEALVTHERFCKKTFK